MSAQKTPKRGPGRPKVDVKVRNRPILPRTTVAQETLDGIRSEGRPIGHVIDDMWRAYKGKSKKGEL